MASAPAEVFQHPPKATAARLRIAVVTPELHRTGGTERATFEIVDKLVKEHHVCLFAHRWEPDGSANICFHRVPVLPWPGMLRFLSFFASASMAVWRGEKRHGAYDGIYSPGPNCRQVQVSTAWFCQARQLDLFRSGQHRPPPASWMDWLKLANRWSYARIGAGVEQACYRSPRLHRVISLSQLLSDDLIRFYGLSAEHVIVVPAGVNAVSFDPAERLALRAQARRELGLADGQFVFFFIGNNWLIKGLYHVMRALADVPGALLCIVGADVERAESWQRFSRELGVAERIRYLPRRRDVIYYYGAADALLAPSVYDTFALMPMEAMACGLPVIVSRQCGVAEILGKEDALVVSRPDETAELSAAMRLMAGDSALRQRLIENGLRLARENPWDRIHQAVLRELLAVAVRQASANGGGQ